MNALERRRDDKLGVRMFSMHILDKDHERRRAATEEVIEHLVAGKIEPAISVRLRLAEAAKAHAMMERGEVLGKLVLKP